ncbi:type I restriction enzyme S subunit [Pedobacter sp. UYEF25]
MRAGWEIKKLGDVCSIGDGNYSAKYPKASEFVDSGVPFLTATNLKSGTIVSEGIRYISKEQHAMLKKGHVLKNDLVIVVRGSSTGNNSIVQAKYEGSNLNSQLAYLRVKDNELDSRYLFSVFNSPGVKKVVLYAITGSAQPQLPNNKLLDICIPIPPLPEQQRIVAILDKAFAAISKAKANEEQNLRNAKELFESYLQGVFENKGEDWEEKNLEDLADEKCTLSYGIVQPGEEYPDGLPVIRPTDLKSKFISLNGLKRIDPKISEGYKRTKLVGDELLLCVRGTTGLVSVATKDLKDANVTRGIVPIRLDVTAISQEFGYYLLISNYIQRQIKAKTYGAALMQINIGDLRKLNTPYPPLKTQQTIVVRLDAISTESKKLQTIYQQKINNLEELKKSILQKAFSGELRI